MLWSSVYISLLFLIGGCNGQQPVVTDTFTMEENLATGQPVGRVTTRPGYTYELSSELRYFSVDSPSGDIRVRDVLDREELGVDTITFIVKARSIEQPSSFFLIEVTINILDINDNSPKFTSEAYNFTVRENDLPSQPFTLTANDPDRGVNGSSALVYSIFSGNSDDYWRLNTTTIDGVKHASLQLLKEVNREEIRSFQLRVKARDSGTPPRSSTVNVNIEISDENDNDPSFGEEVYTASVFEDHSTSGDSSRIVLTNATDLDDGFNSALVYSLAPNDLFTIDPQTGWISLSLSLQNQGYGAEPSICKSSNCAPDSDMCHAVCILEVQVSDQEGSGSSARTSVCQVNIEIDDINDHAPSLTIDNLPLKVSEDVRVGGWVAKITVNDRDKGPNRDISLTISHGNDLGHFGEPRCLPLGDSDPICLITTAAPLDKENKSSYNLTFTASDSGNPPLSTSQSVILTVIDSNDHEPQFPRPLYEVTVSELSPVSSFVAALTATDGDEGECCCYFLPYISLISNNLFSWTWTV